MCYSRTRTHTKFQKKKLPNPSSPLFPPIFSFATVQYQHPFRKANMFPILNFHYIPLPPFSLPSPSLSNLNFPPLFFFSLPFLLFSLPSPSNLNFPSLLSLPQPRSKQENENENGKPPKKSFRSTVTKICSGLGVLGIMRKRGVGEGVNDG